MHGTEKTLFPLQYRTRKRESVDRSYIVWVQRHPCHFRLDRIGGLGLTFGGLKRDYCAPADPPDSPLLRRSAQGESRGVRPPSQGKDNPFVSPIFGRHRGRMNLGG